MRIAILHNYMDNIGGAELVDLTLAKELGADIYTTNIDKKKIKAMGFDDQRVYSIGKIPIHAPFKQQMAFERFRRLNLKRKYDLYLIAGDWAMAAAKNNKPNIWYVYSPIREIWDLRDYTRERMVSRLRRPVFDLWTNYHRKMNLKYVKEVDKIIAISETVRERVKKYLRRESIVIYPPTDTTKYHYNKNGDYWLSVNRLIHHKRVDVQLKAFSQIPKEKLIVVGCYEKAEHFQKYVKEIKKMELPNVKLMHWVESKELIKLYASCKGFITTSLNEDFGLTPIEAMASGKPVIAPNEGGYRETIIDGVTGRLIDNITTEKIVDAVKEIGKNPSKYRNACEKRAKEFDTKIFINKMKKEIGC